MEHETRARSASTVAAAAVGLALAGLCFFAAISLLAENTEVFRDDVQSAIKWVDPSDSPRLERDAIDSGADSLTVIVRILGATQLLVALNLAGFSGLLFSWRGGGRMGLMVMGVLGLGGSLLLSLTTGSAGVTAGLAGSVLLIVLTNTPSTIRDFDPLVGGGGPSQGWQLAPVLTLANDPTVGVEHDHFDATGIIDPAVASPVHPAMRSDVVPVNDNVGVEEVKESRKSARAAKRSIVGGGKGAKAKPKSRANAKADTLGADAEPDEPNESIEGRLGTPPPSPQPRHAPLAARELPVQGLDEPTAHPAQPTPTPLDLAPMPDPAAGGGHPTRLVARNAPSPSPSVPRPTPVQAPATAPSMPPAPAANAIPTATQPPPPAADAVPLATEPPGEQRPTQAVSSPADVLTQPADPNELDDQFWWDAE